MAPSLGSMTESYSEIDIQTPMLKPVAICGMALRLPGGISNPAQLWDFLVAKKSARSRVPESRYNVSSYYTPSGSNGTINSEYGYFLDEDLGVLDTSFFSFTKAELEYIDPHQRQLLEVVRECFESAGEVDYRGRNIGCYVGSFSDDWIENLYHDQQMYGKYPMMLGGDFALPNRISFEFDLRGPSMSIRTACSSALIALHEACVAIDRKECTAAIVGGCHLIMSPTMPAVMAAKGMLSGDGMSKSFDAAADGYGRGEAINCVYLKPLDAAIRDGNPIRAIIRGTAVNNNGKGAGFTVPSPTAHEDVIRHAYRTAGLRDISSTPFVECHGTGTPVGDPIEAAGVIKAFSTGSQGTTKGIYIGSIKPNVGHSEGASGLTSIIKAVLALENRIIPPNINFQTPNPKIPFKEANLTVPVEPTSWPPDRPLRESVNSFGMGGANAHAVIESGEKYHTPPGSPEMQANQKGPSLLVYSANTAASLNRMTDQYHAYLEAHPDRLADLAYTLGARREHLPFRAVSLVHNQTILAATSFPLVPSIAPRIVMVFTGQGAQWAEMGVELYQNNRVFKESLDALDRIIQTLPDAPSWSLAEEMFKGKATSNLHLAAYSQPLCTAIQIALVDLFTSLNIVPFAVIGHSSGELAAAFAAGRLTAKDAIVCAFYRGLACSQVTRPGAMAAVGMGFDEVQPFLTPGAIVACQNSASSVTISGDLDAVKSTIASVEAERPGNFARRLKVDKAYHSEHMKEVGQLYYTLLGQFAPKQCGKKSHTTQFFSSLTGQKLAEDQRLDAEYWRQNLESPVLFHSALTGIITQCKDPLLFLELGPHSALAGPIRQTLEKSSLSHPYIPSLVRFKDSAESFLATIGELFARNIPLDFDKLTNPDNARKVLTDLPTYPWQHDISRLYEPRENTEWRFKQLPKHELLGIQASQSTDKEPCWRNVFHLDHVPWISDHKVEGVVVFPAAAYLAMAIEAIRRIDSGQGPKGFQLRNLVFSNALVLGSRKSTEILTSLRARRQGEWYDFTIRSHNGESWTEHCVGKVRRGHNIITHPRLKVEDAPLLARQINMTRWYKTLATNGVDYGPAFQGVQSATSSTTEQLASARILCTADSSTYYPIHPTTLDAFFQTAYAARYQGLPWGVGKLPIPTSIAELNIAGCPSNLNVRTRATSLAMGVVSAHAEAFGPDGVMVLRCKDAVLWPRRATQFIAPHGQSLDGARLHWQPDIEFIRLNSLLRAPAGWMANTAILGRLTTMCIGLALSHLDEHGVCPKVPHLRKYYDWLRERHSLSQEISMAGIETVAAQALSMPGAPCARAIIKVLGNLMPICKGEVEALEILMSDKTLLEMYNYLNQVDRSPLFRLLSHHQPKQRILEIGAGTGGTTGHVLSESMFSTYTFTDVSAAFFPAAKERFKSYPNIIYKTLDITQNPLSQGFELESFDLIIASNVLHATPYLEETLRNVRKLLHPRGRLLLEELCGETKFSNFITGTLPGWWVGEDDNRGGEPYIPPEQWDKVLRVAGFNGVDDMAFDVTPPLHNMAFMLASPSVSKPSPQKQTLLLCDTQSARLVVTISVSICLKIVHYSMELPTTPQMSWANQWQSWLKARWSSPMALVATGEFRRVAIRPVQRRMQLL